jgi:hypothetical protein
MTAPESPRADVDVAAHRDSYPMGNIHHGTPENPDWGTFCVQCKQSWPCDVSILAAERDDLRARLLAVETLVTEAENGADEWGTCGHEWISLRKFRAVLASPSTHTQRDTETAAQAWDEGYSCGLGDYGKDPMTECVAANPYRADSLAAGEEQP